MRKLRLLLVGALMAFAVLGMAPSPAQACTSQFEPDGCAIINRLCHCLG